MIARLMNVFANDDRSDRSYHMETRLYTIGESLLMSLFTFCFISIGIL